MVLPNIVIISQWSFAAKIYQNGITQFNSPGGYESRLALSTICTYHVSRFFPMVAMDFVCFSRPYPFVPRACWSTMFPLAKVEESEFQQRVQSLESWTTTTFPKLESEANHHEFYESTEFSGGFLLLFLLFSYDFPWFLMFFPCFSHEFPSAAPGLRAAERGGIWAMGAPMAMVITCNINMIWCIK